MIELLERWIAPFKRRVMLMIAKALISSIKDSTSIQIAQIDLGNNELIDSVERVQNFGFSSYPKGGAQAIVVFISGNRDHPVIIAVDDSRYRPHLAEGEAAVYSSGGMIMKIKDDDIELGKTSLKKMITEVFQTTFNTHTHLYAPGPGTPVPSATPLPQSTIADLTDKVKAQ